MNNAMNNPSLISQNMSMMNANPSMASQVNMQSLQPSLGSNPMMAMMANMMASQGSPQANMSQEVFMKQFQEIMRQNPNFMMEQMKLMGFPVAQSLRPNTQSTQNIGSTPKKQAKGLFGNQSASLTNLGGDGKSANITINNLNKLREKEKQKAARIVGKTDQKKSRSRSKCQWRKSTNCTSS